MSLELMEPWYFAYGSNLWLDQMLARTGSIGAASHPPRVARLNGYRLAFQHLQIGEPAYANILKPGEGVLGVAYRCSAADLLTMDRYERGYDRRLVSVTDMRGQCLTAITYVMRPGPAVQFGGPSAEYLQKIVTGARQHALPPEYIEAIEVIAAAGRGQKNEDEE